jgi:hypothetical protein
MFSKWSKRIRVPVLLFPLAFAGCADIGEPWSTGYNKINFYDYAVGLTSTYVRFHALYDNLSDVPVTYVPDTLVIQIIAVYPDGFLAREYFTAGSASLKDSTTAGWASPILQFGAMISKDSLLFTGESRFAELFLANKYWQPCPLPLRPIIQPEATIHGCSISTLRLDEYSQAYVQHYAQFGRSYEGVNVVADLRAMAADGTGRVVLYSRMAGVVRLFTMGHPGIDGWDLI